MQPLSGGEQICFGLGIAQQSHACCLEFCDKRKVGYKCPKERNKLVLGLCLTFRAHVIEHSSVPKKTVNKRT